MADAAQDKAPVALDDGKAKTPGDFLKSIKGKPVVVKLNSGVDYRGILACLDGYMNIAMEQTEGGLNPEAGRLSTDTGSSIHPDSGKKPSIADQNEMEALFRRIALEYVNGQLKNHYGDAFIRGNNVLYISTVRESTG